MTNPVANAQIYGNFAGLESLKRAARSDNPAAVREVARQFESLFARMLIKSMRDAIGPDPIFGSDQEQTYQGMFDDQLSIELTRGHGLGLADMLIRQLQRRGLIGASHGAGAGSGTGAAASGQSASATQSEGAAQSGSAAQSGGSGRSPSVRRELTPSMPPTQPTPSMPPRQDMPSLPPRQSMPFAPATRSTPPVGSTPAVSRADQRSFIRGLWPQAREAGEQLGVAPESLVAQAALETDWGRSVPQDATGRSSNNLFGIKASAGWDGPSVSAGTREFAGGATRATTAQFRAYGSREQSFQDYVALLKSDPHYAAALNTGSNVQAFASALQQGGYATDPEYARKVSAIASDVAGALAEPTRVAQRSDASSGPAPSGRSAQSAAGGSAGILLAANSADPLKLASAGPITGRADSIP